MEHTSSDALSAKVRSWKEEEQASFRGWDFSRLTGRWENESLPWEYRDVIERFRTNDLDLLDMGTGGGEFLLSLGHPPRRTAVTEGYPPNFRLCLETLAPRGIEVRFVEEDDHLDFPDARFDLVLNRHESFSAEEIRRVLKPGGLFITQQVGSGNGRDLVARLLPEFAPPFPENDLDHVIPALEREGFAVLEQGEIFPPLRFFDTGAFVYYAKIIEWEFPGFSVDTHLPALMAIDEEIAAKGFLEGTEHRYYLVARKDR